MRERIRFQLDLSKSWQWLVYVNLLLPVLFFILAIAMTENTMGRFFSYLFQSYIFYIVNPFTDFEKLQGIIGIAIPTFLSVWALRRRDYWDLLITVLIETAILIFFYFSVHQLLIGLLTV